MSVEERAATVGLPLPALIDFSSVFTANDCPEPNQPMLSSASTHVISVDEDKEAYNDADCTTKCAKSAEPTVTYCPNELALYQSVGEGAWYFVGGNPYLDVLTAFTCAPDAAQMDDGDCCEEGSGRLVEPSASSSKTDRLGWAIFVCATICSMFFGLLCVSGGVDRLPLAKSVRSWSPMDIILWCPLGLGMLALMVLECLAVLYSPHSWQKFFMELRFLSFGWALVYFLAYRPEGLTLWITLGLCLIAELTRIFAPIPPGAPLSHAAIESLDNEADVTIARAVKRLGHCGGFLAISVVVLALCTNRTTVVDKLLVTLLLSFAWSSSWIDYVYRPQPSLHHKQQRGNWSNIHVMAEHGIFIVMQLLLAVVTFQGPPDLNTSEKQTAGEVEAFIASSLSLYFNSQVYLWTAQCFLFVGAFLQRDGDKEKADLIWV